MEPEKFNSVIKHIYDLLPQAGTDETDEKIFRVLNSVSRDIGAQLTSNEIWKIAEIRGMMGVAADDIKKLADHENDLKKHAVLKSVATVLEALRNVSSTYESVMVRLWMEKEHTLQDMLPFKRLLSLVQQGGSAGISVDNLKKILNESTGNDPRRIEDLSAWGDHRLTEGLQRLMIMGLLTYGDSRDTFIMTDQGKDCLDKLNALVAEQRTRP